MDKGRKYVDLMIGKHNKERADSKRPNDDHNVNDVDQVSFWNRRLCSNLNGFIDNLLVIERESSIIYAVLEQSRSIRDLSKNMQS